MRRFLAVLVTLLLSAPAVMRSQNVMVAHLKDGTVAELAFKYKPVMTFTENDVVFSAIVDGKDYVVSYPIRNLAKFTFTTSENPGNPPTEVQEVEQSDIRFLIDNYTITVTGLAQDLPVNVYSADGRLLNTGKADRNGTASFSIEELPAGTYIVNSQGITFKVLK